MKDWHCHHRLEDEGFSKEQLIQAGMYWNRPAKELILLTHKEHSRLHWVGTRNPSYGGNFSIEHRKHLSESRTGVKNPNYGKPHSSEWNNKISDSQKGEKGYWFGKKRSSDTVHKIVATRMEQNKPRLELRTIEILNKMKLGIRLSGAEQTFKSMHKELFIRYGYVPYKSYLLKDK